MKKLIDFPEIIINKVKHIQEQEGHKTFTSVVFWILTNYYDKKYFNKYRGLKKEIIPEEQLTPEQVCERAGGKVGTYNGLDVCIINANADGSMKRYIPLSKPELF